jgi:hypothetical protein
MSSFIREFLYKAHIFLIRQIIPGHVSNFPRETFLTPLFSRHCIHMNTLFTTVAPLLHRNGGDCGTGPPESPLPCPKTFLYWQNYVEFREVPIAMR